MARKLKLYFVKREVLARSIEDATKTRGTIYEITLAKEEDQPLEDKPIIGLKPKDGKSK